MLNRYKMAKHSPDITEDRFAVTRNTQAIEAESRLDGIYVIRTICPQSN